MLSNRSWLPGFRGKIFMQNSKSSRYDRRKKKRRERPSERFQNRHKKRQGYYRLKDQNQGAQQRITSVEVFNGKIEKD